MSAVNPGWVLVAGALLVPLLPRRLRRVVAPALPLAAFGVLLALPDGALFPCRAFGLDLSVVRVDALARLFATAFLAASFLGHLFGASTTSRAEDASALLYAGGATGALFAGDLFTLLLHWEVVAFAPVVLIAARKTARARRAALRYLLFQLVSGLLLMVGVGLRVADGGSLAFDALALDAAGTTWILLGFGVKCGWPLLHGWIVDAYPEATPTGTVFLGVFTTKLAVYALLRTAPGAEALVWIGGVLAIGAVVWGLAVSDLRRVICYAMLNQIGIMLCGIGLGGALARDGVAAHAFCHILYDSLLFMATGAVLLAAGTAEAPALTRVARRMPRTTALYLVGAASIASVPLLCGFVSKSMIVSAAAHAHRPVLWGVLVAASAGVFLLAGLKVPRVLFATEPAGAEPSGEAPRPMQAAMALAAGGCVLLGVWPALLYRFLPEGSAYAPYTLDHVLTQLQVLVFAGLAWLVAWRVGLVRRESPRPVLDADALYRAVGRGVRRLALGLARFGDALGGAVHVRVPGHLVWLAKNPPGAMKLAWDRAALATAALFQSPERLDVRREQLALDHARYARTGAATSWPIGTSVLYMSLVFLLFLVVYLLR